MASFVVVTPSRGLIHSRTVAAVMANVEQAEAGGHASRGWRLTHDLPIPACHEQVAEAGLATGADALWFVEEDVVPPDGALCALLDSDQPLAVVDYPVGEHPTQNCAYHAPSGEPLWCGLGCTLIRREVLERLERPWFRTDITYTFRRSGSSTELIPTAAVKPYGGQDIAFARAAITAGYHIAEVPLLAAHARLRELGAPATNDGAHRIDLLTAVERWT